MSGLKDIVKGGWHPDKNTSKEGWRGDFKGVNQVAGWMGKGKSGSGTEEAISHQSAPLSTLKDPASFAPPPKRTNYHNAAAVGASSTTTISGRSGVSSINTAAGVSSRATGLGSPITPTQRQQPITQEQEETPSPPPGPFRTDTTGLSTAGLPKPPVRRGDYATLPPASSAVKSKPPSLPPRLPPRQNTGSPVLPPTYNEATSQSPVRPAANEGYLNQGALSRLGKAGIAVPGFNIDSGSSPRETQPAPTSSPTTNGAQGQMNELQSRFSAMSSKPPNQAAPTTGTSFAQKQAAIKTASSFRNDPSSVSVSDMKSAASTMNNFRQRHGEQVASGLKTANGLNQKYGVVDRVNNMSGVGSSTSASQEEAHSSHPLSPTKKKPPPPPPKKKELTGQLNNPPPIPLASKPRS